MERFDGGWGEGVPHRCLLSTPQTLHRAILPQDCPCFPCSFTILIKQQSTVTQAILSSLLILQGWSQTCFICWYTCIITERPSLQILLFGTYILNNSLRTCSYLSVMSQLLAFLLPILLNPNILFYPFKYLLREGRCHCHNSINYLTLKQTLNL